MNASDADSEITVGEIAGLLAANQRAWSRDGALDWCRDRWKDLLMQWFRTSSNWDISIGSLVHPLTHSLTPLTHSLAPTVRFARAPLHSFPVAILSVPPFPLSLFLPSSLLLHLLTKLVPCILAYTYTYHASQPSTKFLCLMNSCCSWWYDTIGRLDNVTRPGRNRKLR